MKHYVPYPPLPKKSSPISAMQSGCFILMPGICKELVLVMVLMHALYQYGGCGTALIYNTVNSNSVVCRNN